MYMYIRECILLWCMRITERKPLEIVPADMNEAHAYVPYLYARDCIAKMMEDMKLMKRKHITIVTDIEENYKHIEDETQVNSQSYRKPMTPRESA